MDSVFHLFELYVYGQVDVSLKRNGTFPKLKSQRGRSMVARADYLEFGEE